VRYHLAAALLFCVAWASAGTLLKLALLPGTFRNGVARFYVSWLFTTLPFGVAVYLAVVGIEHAITYFVQSQQREAQVARLAEQLTGARLAALQSQLNPHFLFNSLNTATILVREGERDVAASMLEQLSGMLRRTLNRGQELEVVLEDELDLVHQYLAIAGARFSDRLLTRFDIDAGVVKALVPPFALQHLVENAVQHGIARRSNAGCIGVGARRDGDMLELFVSDDGPGIAADVVETPAHGIASTRERIAALYGERASLTLTRLAKGTIARLRVPFHLARVAGDESAL
jgi:LytS/YehU family sensor histidine kinase